VKKEVKCLSILFEEKLVEVDEKEDEVEATSLW